MNNKAIAHEPARVICLGEILFDCLADDIGKSVAEVSNWTPYPGGAPANTACALVKLGTPSAFIGCVGKDKAGSELVELLQLIGVSTSGIQYNDRFPTRQVYVTRTVDGDRSFAGFGDKKPNEFADAYLDAKYLPPELFFEAEFLVIGTLELAYPQTRAAVFRALELAEEYHLKIILDVNWRPMFWLDEQEALPLIKQLWQYVDFLKLAAEEAEWLFDTRDAGAIAHRLNSVEGVLVSDGGARVSYCLSENEGTVNPIKLSAIDTTGAGDAFLAGFIHRLCHYGNQQLQDPKIAQNIVEYACAVGGLTTTNSGAIAAQPTAEEVEAFLDRSL
ncbi:carbohydrate kinase [Waterburya agarophytonicola K14]|uniref:Carbohydrate kinase n=1 Tax=Waterburya agarophytonicola KI4 TaxID=2874699 RepID=A0A964FI26_9CYAN|nr:carbohydrate kinase [Waterburya agarophytonicola]MCC0178094.1 carbohydrate kinase [Waterburya agarophytonicola KI4]